MTSPSTAFITPPDFNSLKELPDSYAWTHQEDYPKSLHDSRKLEAVPIVDLNDPNASKLIENACKTWGVFQVVNHDISIALLDDIERVTNNLFSLPSQQKLKTARSPGSASGYGVARTAAFFTQLMWHEGFTIFGSPLDNFRKLWPQDYTRYCDVVVKYQEQVIKLAEKLMRFMLDGLGIAEEDIEWVGQKDEARHPLQLNSYPACPDPDRAMGLAAHTDSLLFAILYQSNISGLQVLREGQGFVTVPPVRGGLVVNVGDLLHILSNGLYPSVFHRAMVNRTCQRFSIVYFCAPPDGVKISPHPKLVGPSAPPLYPTLTQKEYIDLKRKYNNDTLPYLRLSAYCSKGSSRVSSSSSQTI